jgi:hypothetical protein
MKTAKLPKFFYPKYKTLLVRLGKNKDGGYCVPKKSLRSTDILFSFGLGDDWSFEKDFNKNSNAKIICFDKSINSFFWIKKLIKDFIYFFNFNFNFKKDFFLFFKYRIFFLKKNIFHYKKNLIDDHSKNNVFDKYNFITLKEIKNASKNKRIFLKIDIENSEYSILEDIINNHLNLQGLVVEFHNCHLMKLCIKNFIKRFNLDLVHLHINNYGGLDYDLFPKVIELTFSPRKFNMFNKNKKNSFPVKNLDYPNNCFANDYKVKFI